MTDTETESADETEAQDEGSVSGQEAMQAVEEEMERQIAAASGDGEIDGPTSVTQAQETPEEPLLGDPSTDGSAGTQDGDELGSDLRLDGEEGTADPGVLTPEQLGEMGGSAGSLDEQLDDVGGDTGGEVPGMGDLGGAQPSGQPSVAMGGPIDVIVHREDADGTKTTTTHYGGMGPDANGNFMSHSVTVRPDGETSETFRVQNVDGSGSSNTVNRDGDGRLTSTVSTNTDDDLRETVTHAAPEGVLVIETDPQGDTQITTHVDGVTEVDTAPGFDPASTDDPGPDGDEVVPGGRNEANQEDLEEMAGPTDAGPGNVDPAEHDDGTGGGQEAQGPQPGVDNPPDEGEPTGGGEPVDSSGWDVDPVEEDDFGGEKGPEQSPADAFGAPRPVLDPDDVVPQGDAEPQTAGARPSVAEPMVSRFLQPSPDAGRGASSDDLRDQLADAAASEDPEGDPTGQARGARTVQGEADPTSTAGRSIIEELNNPVDAVFARSQPTSTAGRSIIEELNNPVDAVFARSQPTSPADQEPGDEIAPQPGDADWVEGPGEWVDGVWVPSERVVGDEDIPGDSEEQEPEPYPDTEMGEEGEEQDPEEELQDPEEPEPYPDAETETEDEYEPEEELQDPEEPEPYPDSAGETGDEHEQLPGWEEQPQDEPEHETTEDFSDNTGDDGGRGAAFNSNDGYDSHEPLSNEPLTRAEPDDGGDLFG